LNGYTYNIEQINWKGQVDKDGKWFPSSTNPSTKRRDDMSRRIDLGKEEVVPKKGKKAVLEAIEKSENTGKPITMSADDFLASVGVAVTPKPANGKKNGIRTLTPNEKLRTVVDELVGWKKTKKEAEAEITTREVNLIDYVQPIQEEDGFKSDYQKSYYLAGMNETVTFVSSDRFTAPTEDDIPGLQDSLGDRFNEFLKKETTISLKSGILDNPVLMTELKGLIGNEFPKFFEAKQKWIVADGFDAKRFTLPKRIYDKISAVVKQSKPALK
jgi:hypothetical protein